jgi:hypothetical protein
MTSPRLSRLESSLARVRESWLVPLEGAGEAAAAARPRGGGWSAAEIGTHLVLTEEQVTVCFERLFADPPRATRVSGFRLGRLGLALIPFRSFHVRAPRAVTPKVPLPVAEIVHRAGASRGRLLENLRFADEHRDLEEIVHPHPFFGPLTLFEWARSTALHERRHARQLVEALGASAAEEKRP